MTYIHSRTPLQVAVSAELGILKL